MVARAAGSRSRARCSNDASSIMVAPLFEIATVVDGCNLFWGIQDGPASTNYDDHPYSFRMGKVRKGEKFHHPFSVVDSVMNEWFSGRSFLLDAGGSASLDAMSVHRC